MGIRDPGWVGKVFRVVVYKSPNLTTHFAQEAVTFRAYRLTCSSERSSAIDQESGRMVRKHLAANLAERQQPDHWP